MRDGIFPWSSWVRDTWSLSPDELQRQERALLDPERFETAAEEAIPELRLLFLETALVFHGFYARAEATLAKVADAVPSRDARRQRVWCERCWLAGRSAYALEDEKEARRRWRKLLEASPSALHVAFRSRVSIGIATILLNQGHLTRALMELEAAQLDATPTDLQTLTSVLAVKSLIQTDLALFSDAHETLEREAAILRALGESSAAFHISLERRRLNLLLRGERYHEVGEALLEATQRAGRSPYQQALLLQLSIRLSLDLGNDAAARQGLDDLEILLRENRISRGIVNVLEERCHLAFKEENVELCRATVSEGLRDAAARNDAQSDCLFLFFAARLRWLEGDTEAAQENVKASLLIAETHGYGKVRCHLHLFCGVMLAMQGRGEEASQELWRAHDLARSLSLPSSLTACEIALTFLTGDVGLGELVRHNRGKLVQGFEIWKGWLPRAVHPTPRVLVTRREERKLSLKEWLTLAEAAPGVFVFPEERTTLLLRSGQAPKLFKLEATLRDEALRRLIRKGRLSPSEIHRLSSSAPFHPLRHGPKVRALMQSLRKFVADFDCKIIFERAGGNYHLVKGPTVYIMEPLGDSTTKNRRGSRHLETLRRLFHEHKRLSTTQLREKTGMTRQALRPYLKTLLDEHFVRLIARGRRSAYVLY